MYSFPEIQEKDNIPSKLWSLFISNKEIVQISSINFLGELIDEHLTQKKHVAVIENKIFKKLVTLSLVPKH